MSHLAKLAGSLGTVLLLATMAPASAAPGGTQGFNTASALASTLRTPASFQTVYGPANAPRGYRAFCFHNAAECRALAATTRGERTTKVSLTAERWAELERINLVVNATVKPVTDLALYGSREVWAYPRTAGDCEDYVLLKRRMLMDLGWPASALLITVVRDENGYGHAVLTVRTAAGDYLLDNRTPDTVAWTALPYEFVKRQSSFNPAAWVSLVPVAPADFAQLGEATHRTRGHN